MRESGAEGSEGCGKLRDERHSHVISETRGRERERGGQRMRPLEATSAGHWTEQDIITINMYPLSEVAQDSECHCAPRTLLRLQQ